MHGHDYWISVAFCGEGERGYVLDAAAASEELRRLLSAMNGRYLAAPGEAHGLGREEVYVVPCDAPGVSGECIAAYIGRRLGASWVKVCEGSPEGPCFYYYP